MEQNEAKFLEDCFNSIKNSSIHGIKVYGPFGALINNAMMTRLNNYGIFRYIGDFRHGAWNRGVEFEQDLARIITEILISLSGEQILRKNIDNFMESMLTGASTSELKVVFNQQQIDAMLEDTTKKLAKKVDKELSSSLKNVGNIDDPSYEFIGRSGVTDINVAQAAKSVNLTYNFQPNATLERLFNILTTSTFSAKNYLLDSVAKGINLGLTSDLRFMSGSLSYIGLNEDSIGSLYGRSLNYLKGNQKNNTILQHLQHLRFAYELMGLGQSTGEAKFLIINQRSMSGTQVGQLFKALGSNYADFKTQAATGDIKVYSNRWLIKQVYNKILKDNNLTNKKGNVLFINNL